MDRIRTLICIIAGAFILIIPAFINRYPIVYSDTSTYLASGFELEAPFDRPITYGLFLRLTSLNGISLWSVIGAQALLLSCLIFRLLREILGDNKYYPVIVLACILFLSLCTGISWTTSQVIPDIFTAIMILSSIVILIAKTNKTELFLLYFLFFLSTAMHMSHITFNVGFVLCILILRRIRFLRLKSQVKVRPILIMAVLTLASIGTMGSAFSKSKHVFLMGTLVEHSIAKEYLDEYCESKDYKLCAYKDSLPEKAWQFIWDENSPFYKIGGWKETKTEFNEIIINTLITPKYLALHIKESIKATFHQLLRFKIGEGNGVFLAGTLLYQRIDNYFPLELRQYEKSLQNQNKFGFLKPYNRFLQVIMIISLIGLLVTTLYTLKNEKLRALTILIFLVILMNAWVCGTFANAINRLGSKIIWLIPFLLFTGLPIKIKGIINVVNKG